MANNDDTLGQVITFYSYKGGTGRSMALANCACLLARGAAQGQGQKQSRPQRVLAIDWDLEAPGLHRYFSETGQLHDEQPGLLDLFEWVELETESWNGGDADESYWRVFELFSAGTLERFVVDTGIPGLSLMKAGRFDPLYANRVNGFGWAGLYRRLPGVFAAFVSVLSQRYDYVLVDSRTGLSDTSGICTILVPEKLVVVFTPNTQSLTGVDDLVRKATEHRRASDDLRPLSVFPLPSRIERARPKLLELWRFGSGDEPEANAGRGYQTRFEQLVREVFALPTCDLSEYFDEVELQHVPDYAYGEPLPVESERETRLSLRRSYEAFAERLITLAGPWQRVATVRAQREMDAAVASARQLLDEGGFSAPAERHLFNLLETHRENPELHSSELAPLLARAADDMIGRGEVETPLALLGGALQVAERAFGPESPHLAEYLQRLARVLGDAGRIGDALSAIDRAIFLRQDTADRFTSRLPDMLDERAEFLRSAGRVSEALAVLQESLRLREESAAQDGAGLSRTLVGLGETHTYLAEYDRALAFLNRALALVEVHGSDSAQAARVLLQLGQVESAIGRGDAAREKFERALHVFRERLGDTHPSVAATLDDLGRLALQSGDYRAAQAAYEEAQRIWEKALGPSDPRTLMNMLNLAEVAMRRGDWAEAERQYDRVLAYAEHSRGESDSLLAEVLPRIGDLLYAAGEPERGISLLERSLSSLSRRESPVATARLYHQLGRLYRQRGDQEQARDLYHAALEHEEKVGHRAAMSVIHHELGELLEEARDFVEAEAQYRTSLEINEEIGHRRNVQINLLALGRIALLLDHLDDAERWYDLAVAAGESLRDPRGNVIALSGLAHVHLLRGDYEASWRFLQEALGVAGGARVAPSYPVWVMQRLYEAAGHERFARLWREGQGGDVPAELVDFLQHAGEPSSPDQAAAPAREQAEGGH